MKKAKRGLGSYRFVCFSLVGALGLALAGCGGDSGSTSSGSASAPTSSASSSTASGAASTSTAASSNTNTSSGPTSTTVTGSNVTIAWTPPTQNTDGSALTDLVGYKIHYGTESQTYTDTVSVNNPGIANYVVQNLPAGTYYFAVTAYNSAGVESLASDEVTATLN